MFNLFKSSQRDEIAHALYAEVVKQARQPSFYERLGVPDTPDGRFDMILIHAYLLFRRMKNDPDQTKDISQVVFDLMFADMDQSLRELGLGDIGVSHRIKGMVKAFYGRVSAYDEGIFEKEDTQLSAALNRNLYRKSTPTDDQVLKTVHYIRRVDRTLAKQDIREILKGQLQFDPLSSILDAL